SRREQHHGLRRLPHRRVHAPGDAPEGRGTRDAQAGGGDDAAAPARRARSAHLRAQLLRRQQGRRAWRSVVHPLALRGRRRERCTPRGLGRPLRVMPATFLRTALALLAGAVATTPLVAQDAAPWRLSYFP